MSIEVAQSISDLFNEDDYTVLPVVGGVDHNFALLEIFDDFPVDSIYGGFSITDDSIYGGFSITDDSIYGDFSITDDIYNSSTIGGDVYYDNMGISYEIYDDEPQSIAACGAKEEFESIPVISYYIKDTRSGGNEKIIAFIQSIKE